MRARTLLESFFCFTVLANATAAAESSTNSPRAIRPSDVVFMYDNPKLYETYGCTVLGWAGRANREHIELAHLKGVRLFSASVGFRTEFRAVIDFSEDFLDAACRNFEGKPFIVPWLWDHKYKDQPAWWWCTNSPLYRKYLDGRLVEVMKARPTGLHIDDYTGTAGTVTWQSGCFCRYCLAGFRDYLAKNVPKEKLAELGIDDLSTFDYRKFLLDRGVKPDDYNKRRASLPLAADFYDYHVKANNAFVAAYRKRAEELRGAPLTLCVNSSLTRPDTLVIAPHLSYFCCEVGHNAPSRAVPKHPIYIYKLADGLGRPVTSTASGQDWAYVMEHNLPCLVRTWTALSYAYGHNLMAPHRQWCYTKEKGTHWYTGPTEEYAWLYQFVRKNARLLDGYEAVAAVAVVYDNAARRKGRGNIEPICTALADRNVPFTVVVAGDDWLDYRLDDERLARFKAVIVPKELDMDQSQRKLIEQVKASGRLVVWPDDELLDKLVPQPVAIEGSEHVGVAVRAIPGDENSPAVVHLLNRRYDGTTDTMVPQKGITLRLRRDLLHGRKFTKARLHAPGAEPVTLEVISDDEHTIVKVQKLKLWGIVRLATAADATIVVFDPEGAAARVAAPVCVKVDFPKVFGLGIAPVGLELVEFNGRTALADPVPIEFEPEVLQRPDGVGAWSSKGKLWWLMPPGTKGVRRFRLTSAGDARLGVLTVTSDKSRKFFDLAEGNLPVLRYNHGTVPVPEGIDAKYARGDYVSPLFGPDGEVLTDDYPRDHPHHRGVSWSWPVTRWKDEVRDIWAVDGVWARPVTIRRAVGGRVTATIEAESVWKWADKDPIVREEVIIRAFRQTNRCRFVDVEVRLTALADGVAIGGRPKAGYGGFGLRATSAAERQIVVHADPADATPRRAWLDYSGVFAGGKGRAGVAIFEHVSNPEYPSDLHQYPDCNYVMPAFPGPREVPLSKHKPLVLRHRLWIHSGGADEKKLADVWAAYANPPRIAIEQ